MGNDLIRQIFDKTRGGLDIILDYYPQAEEAVRRKGFKFKIRDEKTPSASLREKDGKWRVTDFGGTGHEMDAIEVFKMEERIQWTSEAVALLAQKYGVDTRLSSDVNKPKISQRDARPDEVDGQNMFDTREHFTPDELRLLGPLVTEDHCRSLGWSPVSSIRYIKDRRVTEVSSTDHYPIFARQCTVRRNDREEYFYKIYQPWYIGKDGDKSRRFTYMPAGKKPQHYVNGLWELRHEWSRWNEQERSKWESDPTNEGKPYKEQKLEHAFLCSGERDALCVRSLGYWPLWLNSETDELTPDDYKEVMKMVGVLYNIPDLDQTGVERGTRLALKYLDVRTIWLPSDMRRRFTDSRGGGAKDFRDYMGIYKDKGNIHDLLELAMPARFWSVRPRKDDSFSYEIDTECLHYFLGLNGFSTLHDETQKEVQYIRRDGFTVKPQTVKDINQFLIEWCRRRALPREIRNLVLNSPKLGSAALDRLNEVTLDFTSYTPQKQLFFFRNACVEVSADGILPHRRKNPMGTCVWERNVIQHDWRPSKESHLRLMFAEGPDGSVTPRLELHGTEQSPFLCYLINSSRLFWREELETAVDALPTEEQRRQYRRDHKYDIGGPLLTDDQRQDQMQCLVSKVFALGYMLHHHKRLSRPWMPIGMDYKIDEDIDRANGGSGKSFMFKAAAMLQSTVTLDGKQAKLTENPHWLSGVTKHTQLLLVDDCERYLSLKPFYSMTTGPMMVNKKGTDIFEIPFSESPKIAATTNYAIPDLDASTLRRLLPVVFSDYYHDGGGINSGDENPYREVRTIKDDFDFDSDLLSSEYDERYWESDLQVIMECVHCYLRMVGRGIKAMPPMDNIIKRTGLQLMGAKFLQWAIEYFAEDSGRLDTFVVRREAFDSFRQSSGIKDASPQSFLSRLRAFCSQCSYIADLNPQEFRGRDGRIMRRPGHTIDGVTGSVEMLYLRTTAERDRMAAARRQQSGEGWHDGDVF